MSDDIVTRLRNEADYWCYDTPIRIFLEAADEIERLWTERETSRNAITANLCSCGRAKRPHLTDVTSMGGPTTYIARWYCDNHYEDE